MHNRQTVKDVLAMISKGIYSAICAKTKYQKTLFEKDFHIHSQIITFYLFTKYLELITNIG